MYFSQKLKVIEEYRKWIEETKEETGVSMKDCYENFLAFLETAGYRKDEEVRKETAREILDEVAKHYGGAWLVELYKKFGVEVGE